MSNGKLYCLLKKKNISFEKILNKSVITKMKPQAAPNMISFYSLKDPFIAVIWNRLQKKFHELKKDYRKTINFHFLNHKF